jgi:hypothetical protein
MNLDLVVWRDSVAAGDDADAPHEWLLRVESDASVADVVQQIATARYLASISGGEATWIIQGDQPLAVVAQQWTEPRFVVDSEMPIRDVLNPSARPHVQARYWCQVSPDRVLDCLRTGQPLPDKSSR